MKVTIGRFGLDIDQSHTATLEHKGNDVSLSGLLSADGGTTDLEALREQLNGLANNPYETFYPVTFDEAPTFNGYYNVTDASVTMGAGSLVIGHYPFTVSMTKVGSFAAPQLEARLFGALRTNWYTFATDAPWHAVPDAATGYATGVTATGEIRATADGNVRAYPSGHTTYMYNGYAGFTMPPENYYDGSAKVRAGQIDPISSTVFTAVRHQEDYVVPTGVTKILVDVRGAQGGGYAGGKGGRVICTVNVTAGETLTVYVGSTPGISNRTGGFNGGGNGGTGLVSRGDGGTGFGGGGASDIRQGGTAYSNRVVVAGGGGGTGGAAVYGFGGGVGAGTSAGDAANPDGSGGKQGTATAGGAAGTSGGFGTTAGAAGTTGLGGAGASASSSNRYGGGGGGGGLYGGGGGSGTNGTAGSGGGGSAKSTGVDEIRHSGYQTGDGAIFISPVTSDAPNIDRYTVVGAQAPNTPFGWELSNGIVAVTPTYVAGKAQFDFKVWNGSSWSAARQWVVTDSGASAFPALLQLTAFTVLGNNPEQTIIRANYEYGLNADQVTITLLLRRGSPIVDVTIDASQARTWGWRTVATSASTNMSTGNGLNESSADGAGNQWVMLSPWPSTRINAGQSGAYLTGAQTTMPVGIGFHPGGLFPSSIAQLRDQWYAYQTVSVNPVLGWG